MFRMKKSLPMGYDRQGYIYFTSRMYRHLSRRQQSMIRLCCERAGGEYAKALFEFVTTDNGATNVCMKHHLSDSTLERIVRKYYCIFPTEE